MTTECPECGSVSGHDPIQETAYTLNIEERGLIVEALRVLALRYNESRATFAKADEAARLCIVMCTAKVIVQGPIND